MWFCVFNGAFGRRLDKQAYKNREQAEEYAKTLMMVGEITGYEIVKH